MVLLRLLNKFASKKDKKVKKGKKKFYTRLKPQNCIKLFEVTEKQFERRLLQNNINLRRIQLDQQVNAVLPRVPAALQEAVQRLLSRDPHPRPTTQLLPLIKYFK